MATGSTTNYNFPYPQQTDPVDVAGDVQALADSIDAGLKEIIEDKSAALFTNATVSNGFTLPVYNDSLSKMILTLDQDLSASGSPSFAALNVTASAGLTVSASSSGSLVNIIQTGSGNAFLVQDSASVDSTPFVINSSGNVGIGASVPSAKLHVIGNTNQVVWIDLASNTAGNSPQVVQRRSRGTIDSPTAVLNGDVLGQSVARGYGTTAYSSANRAVLNFSAEEDWTDTAQGTRIAFSTTLNGTTSTSEHMRITNSGNVGIGTTSPSYKLHVSGTGYFSDKLSTVASSVGNASINIPHGSAPTSPVDGDLWTTSDGLYAQINGVTFGPLGSGSGSIPDILMFAGM